MKAHPKPIRALTVASVLAPLAIAFLAMIAAYAGLPRSAGFDVAWTFAALGALAGMVHARGRAQHANRVRWTLWAIAAGCWLVGQLGWDLFGVIGFPSSPNVADFGWYGFALLVMASMLRLPRSPRAVRVVFAFESLPLIAAAVALSLAMEWSRAGASGLALAPKLAAIAYPVLYISAAVLTLQATASGCLRGMRSTSLRLVLAGLAAQALAFSLWTSQLLQGTYSPGHSILDPLWVLGLTAIGIGGLLAAVKPEPEARFQEPDSKGVVLPAGMFMVLLVALVTSRLIDAPAGETITLEAGLMFCGAALIARSALLGRHAHVLLSRERVAMAQLAQRESELAKLNQQLVEDSRRDALTGIGNRRALADDLPLLEALHRDGQEMFALALCDVDHFKSYNDKIGHLAGDQALRMIASIARGALRESDAAYRFGGEELLLVLRNVSESEATRVAERVRAAVARAALPHPDGEDGVLTVSIGVACADEDPGQLLARADAALYQAKRLGRNRVISSDHAGPAPTPAWQRTQTSEDPVPRQLRSMLAVSRAAAAREAGPMPVLEALAEAIHTELSFQVVAVNLREGSGDTFRVVLVLGDQEARSALLGTTNSLAEWEGLLAVGDTVHGAAWLAAGSYDYEMEGPVWTPPEVASLFPDAWHPEDMLLLPLRASSGELLGIVSVDQPVLGRRPSEAEIGVLMAVVDHAGLALDQAQREEQAITQQSDELRLAAVMLLAETLDLRDPSTALHSTTVGQFARATARQLGLGPDHVLRVHAAGVLHDLGKLGIADAILYKPGPLDDSEWREMKRHPDLGARILEHAGMHDIASWVRAHHERVDGGGYPAGLSGDQISLEARILAVADAYEAMITDRPYRAGMLSELARAELRRCAGTQFDAHVVDAFLRAVPVSPAAYPSQTSARVAAL
jgi:diguanylate cyclase (GGDEF)-like protein